jgi:hypothetical protein
MKITRISNLITHLFNVEYDGKEYPTSVWTDSDSSEFIDWDIIDMEGEAVDNDISNKIIEEITKQWEKL